MVIAGRCVPILENAASHDRTACQRQADLLANAVPGRVARLGPHHDPLPSKT
jgi:hypothetical protein